MAHEIKLPHWQAYVTPTDDGRAFIEWRAIVAGHQVAVELERDGPHDMLSLFVDGRCVWTEVADTKGGE